MKSFLVIGLGRFGTSLACELCALGHEVMAVDLREERVQEVAGSVTHAAAGDARDPEVLRALGARNFDCAVVSAGDDVGTSALIVLNLKELGVPQVVGKARSAVHHRVLEKIGARVIYPEKDMALWLGRKLTSKNLLDIVTLDNNVEIRTIKVPEHLIGKSVEEIQIRRRYGLNIIAIENREKTTTDIVPSYRFVPEDMIIVIGDAEKMDQFEDSIDD